MSERKRVGVVGCGIFGAETAICLADAGFDVTVYEANSEILAGASRNNQNRLHLGFHYPRDLETGLQSIRGFDRFVEKYPECIERDFPNAYFIADQGSYTSPRAFIEFCDRLGAAYTTLDALDFPVQVQGAASGVLCGEVVYDCAILSRLVRQRLADAAIPVMINTRVDLAEERAEDITLVLESGERQAYDAVVNCSYADHNRITGQLGYPAVEREYEYTVVPIIELDMPKVGITIMDGPFMTLLPHGKSKNFLLYNVETTVVARSVAGQLDRDWLVPATAPFAAIDKAAFFERMIDRCKQYVPALATARMVGWLEGPRMVLARNHATDSRPSLINSYSGRYHTLFSGKIDHCVWVAEELTERLRALLGTAGETPGEKRSLGET